jgi:hypothetical protein
MGMNKPGCEDYLEEVSNKRVEIREVGMVVAGRDGRSTIKRSTEWKE